MVAILDHFVNGPGPKAPAAQKRRAAGEAVEPAPARRVEQIDHARAFVGVFFVIEDSAPGRPHQRNVGKILEIIVFRLEAPGPEVEEHLFEPSLGIAQKHAVRVTLHLVGMQHGGNAAENDRDLSGAESRVMANARGN